MPLAWSGRGILVCGALGQSGIPALGVKPGNKTRTQCLDGCQQGEEWCFAVGVQHLMNPKSVATKLLNPAPPCSGSSFLEGHICSLPQTRSMGSRSRPSPGDKGQSATFMHERTKILTPAPGRPEPHRATAGSQGRVPARPDSVLRPHEATSVEPEARVSHGSVLERPRLASRCA